MKGRDGLSRETVFSVGHIDGGRFTSVPDFCRNGTRGALNKLIGAEELLRPIDVRKGERSELSGFALRWRWQEQIHHADS